MKPRLIAAIALSLLALSGCGGGLPGAVEKGALAPKFEDTKLDGDYLWVRGIAAANQLHASLTQRRAMSREAAIANAYQRAAEYIIGGGVIANVKVKDALAQDSTLETKVQGVVRGAEIHSSEYTADDGCTVIVRIPRAKLKAANIEFGK